MSKVNKITQENAEQLIKQTNGAIFGVKFRKADGTLREMTARLGVSKHVKGKGLAFDPSEYELLPVFDMESQGYRMLRLTALKSLTVDGQTFKVV